MVPVKVVGSKGMSQGTAWSSGANSRLSSRRGVRWRMSRHSIVASTSRLTRPTKGEHKGSRVHPTRLVTLAADGMGDTTEDDGSPEKAPIVRPPKFNVYNSFYKMPAISRLIYPDDVENQKESVICHGGDYTYMRNTEPITDEQPNFPSAMFLAKEDPSKAEGEYTDAIYTVGEKNKEVYWEKFRHTLKGRVFNPYPKVPPPRVFGLGLPLFSTAHEEFARCSIKQYDFVGISAPGNQPLPVPYPEGRGRYDTDGALFVSRIVGVWGGLVSTYDPTEINIATYQPDNTSQVQTAASPADRLAAFRWTLKEVMRNEETDFVSIVYDPNDPFTAEEQACVKELLGPKGCAVVFLIPKDEPADMATDQRYAVMRALQDAGALVVSSVDGDYLRTPLTKAGWGRVDYNIVVGDTEAPDGSGDCNFQFLEGTSITAAAAGCAACIGVSQVMRPRRAIPHIVKQILSTAAVDLKQVLLPKTIADLEAYRDQCIADCGLSTQKSSPQYQSMVNGLGIDAKILRFTKEQLESAFKRVFVDTLVALADVRASNKDLLPPANELQLSPEQRLRIAMSRIDISPSLGVSALDFTAWIRLIEAAGDQQEYAELAETAGTLAGLIPFINFEFCAEEFAMAICDARKVIAARGPVREDMLWVLGVSGDTASPVREDENPDPLEGDASQNAIRGSAAIEETRKQLMEQFKKQWGMDTSQETVQEGQPDPAEGSGGEKDPDEVQDPPDSELSADEQLGADGRDGPEVVEAEPLGNIVKGSEEQVASDTRDDPGSASSTKDGQGDAASELLGEEDERSWAGLLQHFVDLVTGKLGGKEGQEKQGDIDEDGRLSNLTGVGNKRTWVGLIEYLNDLLKKAFNI